jgi:hypothetical protein
MCADVRRFSQLINANEVLGKEVGEKHLEHIKDREHYH